MNEQERAKLKEYIELFNEEAKKQYEQREDETEKYLQRKIMYIGKSTWCNAITKKKQTIEDLYCYANYDEWYPAILTKVIVKEYTEETIINDNGKEEEIRHYNTVDEIQLHEVLVHRNLGRPTNITQLNIKDKNLTISLIGENFCTTVHGNMCFGKIDRIEKIIAGQLIGQNGNSPMSEKFSVVNDRYDYPVRTNDYSETLKSNADILCHITGYSMKSIFEHGNFKIQYKNNLLKQDEMAIKLREKSHYVKVHKPELEAFTDRLSDYYKPITYEMQQKRLEQTNIQKQEFDMSVIGLGSAGTGVLDQVARSNFFEKYLLIDFDTIEQKNKRNQWYTNGQIGVLKTEATERNIRNINNNTQIERYSKKFQEVNLEYMKSKYVVSGFDNLECRKELFEKIQNKEFEADYLIDLRYLDLACSIYFIDTKDEKQMSYYKKQLDADIKGFEEQKRYIETFEEMKEWVDKYPRRGKCHLFTQKYFPHYEQYHRCDMISDSDEKPRDCGDDDCVNCWLKALKENNIKIEVVEENTCLKQNIIDIYKFSSSFVFSAIREIESENAKPFTHIEAQTDVLPTYTVFKK